MKYRADTNSLCTTFDLRADYDLGLKRGATETCRLPMFNKFWLITVS